MDNKARIPIRIKPAGFSKQAPPADDLPVAEAVPAVTDRPEMTLDQPAQVVEAARQPGAGDVTHSPQPATRDTRSPVESQHPDQGETLEVWRDRALRLQAEIENFRKRQQRLAEERIVADRERLLRAFLDVADDLERALATDGVDARSLRQGVDLTHQAMMRILDREGVEPIRAAGQPFDPARHEAVGAVPHQVAGAKPDTVVEVVQPGYRLGERLLRPARVIVAT